MSLGEEDESARTLSKTKSPTYVISLGFVAFNDAVIPLIWLLSEYRLTVRDYEAKSAIELVSWINNTFDIFSVTVMLQQDGALVRTSNRVQHSANFLLLVEKHVAVLLARRQPIGLRPPAAY